MQKSRNVKVFVRVRPPLPREAFYNSGKVESCLAVDGKDIYATKEQGLAVVIDTATNNITNSGSVKKFSFEGVLGEDKTQEDTYKMILPELMDSWLAGVSCTLFAYGISGSGKTFTMVGTDKQPGILPKVSRYLFDQIDEISSDHNYIVQVSAIQVYMEKCYDLLNKGTEVKFSVLPNSIAFEEGFKMTEVSSAEEIMMLIQKAKGQQITASTCMNSASTRGHVIYTIQLIAEHRDSGKCTESKFNIVDLAGSERILKSGVVGVQLKESIKINLSLTTLVSVVESLVNKPNQVEFD